MTFLRCPCESKVSPHSSPAAHDKPVDGLQTNKHADQRSVSWVSFRHPGGRGKYSGIICDENVSRVSKIRLGYCLVSLGLELEMVPHNSRSSNGTFIQLEKNIYSSCLFVVGS